MRLYLIVCCVFTVASCGVQKEMSRAKAISNIARETAGNETVRLGSIKSKIAEKTSTNDIDSVQNKGFLDLVAKLDNTISNVQQNILQVDAATVNKKTFRRESKKPSFTSGISILDSFNTTTNRRESIYEMVRNAVDVSTYKMFELAAFFDPGVYKISAEARKSSMKYFLPMIDSIAAVVNKYKDIPKETQIVFVGYSDNTPIVEGGELYKELALYLKKKQPTQSELNLKLSELRAQEMINYLGSLLTENAAKFAPGGKLYQRTIAYGKGEEYPSPTITDYKANDSRRRIVLSYWTVLPKL